MIVKTDEQNIMAKEHFYKGEGTLELKAAIGFGGVPTQEGSRVMSAMRMTIPADASVGIHTHGNAEELYVVLSGKGIHTTSGEDSEINPGDVINTPAGIEHGVKPVGDEPLVLQASLIKTN